MKTLLVMRHAKSSWSDATLSDHDRPLNSRGRYDAPRIGELLLDEDLSPELIISSSARRAVETARRVAIACDYDATIAVTRDLYHADPEIFLSVVREQGADFGRVMIVGHNPGIEELVEQLTGGWYRMPTAALAVIRLELNDWSQLEDETEGSLTNLWLPRELPD